MIPLAPLKNALSLVAAGAILIPVAVLAQAEKAEATRSEISVDYTVTWPANVKWPEGVPPVQTTGAHTDIYTFMQVGAEIYGQAVQNF